MLPIRKFGDPVLRQRAGEVEEVTDVQRRLIADMIETMREAPGVGLAATQIGVLERIFVWEVGEEHGAFINPVVVSRNEETEAEEEGCLSLPGLLYPVERVTELEVSGLDENGEAITIEATDFQARVFQHEIDHLDGVLFIDRLPEALRRAALSTLREQMLSTGE
jgi:peptide deformylase